MGEESKKNFLEMLEARQLSNSTVTQYTLYFDKIELLYDNGVEINKELINQFLNSYKSNLVRSFLRLYLEFKDINLRVPRITGRKRIKKPVVMAKKDLEAVLWVLERVNKKVALMVELSYYGALRREEVCNIRVGDIMWDVWQNERHEGIILLRKTKGKKERYVMIPKEFMLKLKDYINADEFKAEDYLFYKNKNSKDIPISNQTYWHEYRRVVKELFGNKYKLHTLRTTMATDWFEEGLSMEEIKHRLGHSSITTTERYIIPDDKKMFKKWSVELKKLEKDSGEEIKLLDQEDI